MSFRLPMSHGSQAGIYRPRDQRDGIEADIPWYTQDPRVPVRMLIQQAESAGKSQQS